MRLLAGFCLQLRITRRRRQHDCPAAGHDAARLLCRAGNGEIVPRLCDDTPPMRRNVPCEPDILLGNQRDAVRRCYCRRCILDACRIDESISIGIRCLVLGVCVERRACLDDTAACRTHIALGRSKDDTILCMDFACNRNSGIPRRIAAPKIAAIQKACPLDRRFPIKHFIPVK